MTTSLIAVDPDILGGTPCFAGTRLPIAHVLASLDKGVSLERLQASWPFLTEAHIEAARQSLLALDAIEAMGDVAAGRVLDEAEVQKLLRPRGESA